MATAFVFPGQGSQSVGMQSALAEHHALVEATYREGGDAIGVDLWQLTREGPKEDLDQTVNTQPAMLCAGVAAWRVYNEQGGAAPQFLAGHSLGEYSALVAAGALEFQDGVRLVVERARQMQSAVPAGVGAMAVVLGLDDAAVAAACQEACVGDELAQAVNLNAPGQVAIAGTKAGVEHAIAAAKDAGAKRAMLLPVSVPSHCDLMRPAANAFKQFLEDIALELPAIPVIHNFDVQAAASVASLREALYAQLFSPVRWVETVQFFAGEGVNRIVECGPGKVLAGLTRRIDRSLQGVALDSHDVLHELTEASL